MAEPPFDGPNIDDGLPDYNDSVWFIAAVCVFLLIVVPAVPVVVILLD